MNSARFLLPFSLLTFAACSSDATKKDPVAEARFQNEKRIGDADITKKQQRDADFMVEAASDGLLEVELNKLAQQKAATPVVRELGQQLAAAHADMSRALTTLAEQKGIAVPAALGSQQQQSYQDMAGLPGTEFDKKYLETIIDGHANAVDNFDGMSEDAYDGDIRGFAAKYLPTLKDHLDLAKKAQDQLADAK